MSHSLQRGRLGLKYAVHKNRPKILQEGQVPFQ